QGLREILEGSPVGDVLMQRPALQGVAEPLQSLELLGQEVPSAVPAAILRGDIPRDHPPDAPFRHLQVEDELRVPGALRLAYSAAPAAGAAVAPDFDALRRPRLLGPLPAGARLLDLPACPSRGHLLPLVVEPGTLADPLELRE